MARAAAAAGVRCVALVGQAEQGHGAWPGLEQVHTLWDGCEPLETPMAAASERLEQLARRLGPRLLARREGS